MTRAWADIAVHFPFLLLHLFLTTHHRCFDSAIVHLHCPQKIVETLADNIGQSFRLQAFPCPSARHTIRPPSSLLKMKHNPALHPSVSPQQSSMTLDPSPAPANPAIHTLTPPHISPPDHSNNSNYAAKPQHSKGAHRFSSMQRFSGIAQVQRMPVRNPYSRLTKN
jgi:hypothetical protein